MLSENILNWGGTGSFRQRAGIGLGLVERGECGLLVCCGDEDFRSSDDKRNSVNKKVSKQIDINSFLDKVWNTQTGNTCCLQHSKLLPCRAFSFKAAAIENSKIF